MQSLIKNSWSVPNVKEKLTLWMYSTHPLSLFLPSFPLRKFRLRDKFLKSSVDKRNSARKEISPTLILSFPLISSSSTATFILKSPSHSIFFLPLLFWKKKFQKRSSRPLISNQILFFLACVCAFFLSDFSIITKGFFFFLNLSITPSSIFICKMQVEIIQIQNFSNL